VAAFSGRKWALEIEKNVTGSGPMAGNSERGQGSLQTVSNRRRKRRKVEVSNDGTLTQLLTFWTSPILLLFI
jgi:hypothetical protein